jgi:hypothetical protein
MRKITLPIDTEPRNQGIVHSFHALISCWSSPRARSCKNVSFIENTAASNYHIPTANDRGDLQVTRKIPVNPSSKTDS